MARLIIGAAAALYFMLGGVADGICRCTWEAPTLGFWERVFWLPLLVVWGLQRVGRKLFEAFL